MKPSRIRWTIVIELAIERILVPITGDQPRPACASALTSRRDGCVFLAKNAPSSIAALSTGICRRASSALMPSGRSLRFEDEVEQHRDQLDRHRLELGRPLPERRLLQVAQDVVLALRDAGELDERRRRGRIRFARLQPGEALAQLGVAMIGVPGT